MKSTVNRLFAVFAVLVIVTAFAKIVFHIQFWELPVLFFVIGLVAALYNREFSIYLFVFMFPFINSTPLLFETRYALNYLSPSLFLLSGMALVLIFWPDKHNEKEAVDKDFYLYYLFLLILVISTLFVLLRWSNITLPSSNALGADTPVSPDNPVSPEVIRISFGSIFPVVSLFIYFIAPFIFFKIRSLAIKENVIFKWLSYGFAISVVMAVVQKLSGRSLISDRLGKDLQQYYGGFSDFNAFGFFSGVMFMWATYEIRKKNVLGYVTFVLALAGCLLSGSRTVFFFIFAGVLNLLYFALKDRKRQQKFVSTLLIVGVLLLVILGGGTLIKRVQEGFSEQNSLYKKVDAITNGRLWMTSFTLATIRDNLVGGIGTGTFTFYLAYKNYLPYKQTGEKYLYDLTLNHYLLVFAENGVLAFLCFTGFLIFLWRNSEKKLLMGVILFSLLFNNFFWFPEAFLLFWVITAVNHQTQKQKSHWSGTTKKIMAGGVVLLVILFKLFSFQGLHPKSWAQEVGFRYDYGFWYPEKDELGNRFYWTREKAGVCLGLDAAGESTEIKLVCGAPLAHLQDKKQQVLVYWEGRLYKEIMFTENSTVTFKIKSVPHGGGFLEVRTIPAFNLKKMALSNETRDLGIRFYMEQIKK